jgi:hypothetical protein
VRRGSANPQGIVLDNLVALELCLSRMRKRVHLIPGWKLSWSLPGTVLVTLLTTLVSAFLSVFTLSWVISLDLIRALRNRGQAKIRPPLNAEFLFYIFLDPKNCDALVGDLEERYGLIRKKFGASRANFWYWTQTIRSVGPIASAWLKNVLKGATGMTAVIELLRRIRH